VRTDRDKFTNQNGRNREIFDFFLQKTEPAHVFSRGLTPAHVFSK
jgi:hypothetical protein